MIYCMRFLPAKLQEFLYAIESETFFPTYNHIDGAGRNMNPYLIQAFTTMLPRYAEIDLPGISSHIINGIKGTLPSPMHEAHLLKIFSDVTEQFHEPGKRKLGLIACALPELVFI